jgi:hypothetical protein
MVTSALSKIRNISRGEVSPSLQPPTAFSASPSPRGAAPKTPHYRTDTICGGSTPVKATPAAIAAGMEGANYTSANISTPRYVDSRLDLTFKVKRAAKRQAKQCATLFSASPSPRGRWRLLLPCRSLLPCQMLRIWNCLTPKPPHYRTDTICGGSTPVKATPAAIAVEAFATVLVTPSVPNAAHLRLPVEVLAIVSVTPSMPNAAHLRLPLGMEGANYTSANISTPRYVDSGLRRGCS